MKFLAHSAPVGDFQVWRALPQRARRFVGPFCFLDHFGPHTAVGDATSGIGPHPHIGLATVTYLFEGEALHRDSLGTEQLIRPGDVNWMTAGRGIVHAERTPEAHWGRPLTLHGLQVWVGLPLAAEEAEPSFQHFDAEELPLIVAGSARLDLVLGRWGAVASPVLTASPTIYGVFTFHAAGRALVPDEWSERALYVVEGEVAVGGEVAGPHELVVLEPGRVELEARSAARVALLGGEPLDGSRHMLWNFVSSRVERLEQAREDWMAGRFPPLVGDPGERIAVPPMGRLARRPPE